MPLPKHAFDIASYLRHTLRATEESIRSTTYAPISPRAWPAIYSPIHLADTILRISSDSESITDHTYTLRASSTARQSWKKGI